MFSWSSRPSVGREPVKYSGKANAYKIFKLLTTNAGDPAQVIREVLSNAEDAKATYATIVPFPFPSDLAGFAILDDGHGMSAPVGTNAQKEEVDAKGKYPQIYAFLDVANSTKLDGDTMGFMGLGSKLLFDAKHRLFVATKTEQDEHFTVLDIPSPATTGTAAEIQWKTAEEVQELVIGRRDAKAGNPGGLAVLGLEHAERVAAFEKEVLSGWLEEVGAAGGHGTLILNLGVSTGFADLLANFDKAIGDEDDNVMEELGFKRNYESRSAQGDDRIELKTYMLFKTQPANILVRENLVPSGFDQTELDTLADKGLLKEERDLMAVNYLTLGNTTKTTELPVVVRNEDRFRLKTLQNGYPFVLPRQNAVQDANRNNPLIISRWNNAGFQDRFATYFDYEGSPVVVLVAVDGVDLRLQSWSMLDRQGGKRNVMLGKHVAMTVGEQSGVLLCSKGVPMMNFTKLLDSEYMGDYGKLTHQTYKNHFTIFINADHIIQPVLDRTQATKNSMDKLQSQGFLEALKDALNVLRARNTVFAKLMQRALKESTEENASNEHKAWEEKMQKVLKQSRCQVTCPSPSGGSSTEHVFIMPERGQEATVQHIFSSLSAALTDDHFKAGRGIEHLAKCWPRLLHCNNAQGLDALALRREDLGAIGSGHVINPANMKLGLPMSNLLNLEFKVNLLIPEDSSKQSYNHSLGLTDMIICNKFKIGNLNFPLPKELPSGLYVRDKLDNLGEMCLKYRDTTTREMVTIPTELEGHAFFMIDIRDSSGNLIQKHRARATMHNAVLVVALPGLIDATFRNITPRKEDRVQWFGLQDAEEEEELLDPGLPTPSSGRSSVRRAKNTSGRARRSTRRRNPPRRAAPNDEADGAETSAAAAVRGQKQTRKRSRK